MRYTRGSLAEEIRDLPYSEPGDARYKRQKVEKKEEKQERVSALYEIEIKRKNKKIKQSLVGCIALVFILATVLMCRYASIYEMNYSTKQINTQLEAVNAENRRLEAIIQSESNIVDIDSVAQNELGLQKPQAYQTVNLSIAPVDQTQMINSIEETDVEEDLVWYKDIFKSVKEFLGFID
ncbi:MAG: hypothetical protein IJZ90_03585 [Clostridia bacterium]|nr:hypothetical protein [Clostridia bacterium]